MTKTINKINLQSFSGEAKHVHNAHEAVAVTHDKNFLPFNYKNEIVEEAEFTKSQMQEMLRNEYAKGVAEGQKNSKREFDDAYVKTDLNFKTTLEKLIDEINQLKKKSDIEKNEFKKELGEVAVFAIKHLTGELLKERETEIISNGILKALEQVPAGVKVVVKTSADMADKLKSDFQEIIAKKQINMDIEFVVDNLLKSSCQLLWESEGIIFDLNQKKNELEEILDEYVKSL